MSPSKILRTLRKDPVLKGIVNDASIQIPESDGNVYTDLVKSIVYQQISTKAADSIYSKFLALFDGFHPQPNQILNRNVEELRAAGLSRQKASYIHNIAEYFNSADPELEFWVDQPDHEILDALTSIKGVGVWTAQMVLMFTLYRSDVFPITDHGIKTGMQRLYGDKLQAKEDFLNIAERWRPFRTFACIAIWNAH